MLAAIKPPQNNDYSHYEDYGPFGAAFAEIEVASLQIGIMSESGVKDSAEARIAMTKAAKEWNDNPKIKSEYRDKGGFMGFLHERSVEICKSGKTKKIPPQPSPSLSPMSASIDSVELGDSGSKKGVVDGKDQVTIKKSQTITIKVDGKNTDVLEETTEKVSAQEFIGSDRFQNFGTSEERLKCLTGSLGRILKKDVAADSDLLKLCKKKKAEKKSPPIVKAAPSESKEVKTKPKAGTPIEGRDGVNDNLVSMADF